MSQSKERREYRPKYLGRPVSGPISKVELIPWEGGDVVVTLHCTEFTTICPITGQPDYGRLEISYIPDARLIETKSLKLFLQGYRDRKGFNEEIVSALADDLYRRAKPAWLHLTGHYNVRGGIAVSCTAERGERPLLPPRQP